MKQLPRLPLTPTPASPPEERPSFPSPPPRRKITRKFLTWLGIAFITFLLLTWVFRPTPIAVDTATIQAGTLQVTIDAEGKTRVRERFTIAAEVNGHLERITLEEGDIVDKGTIVARIDPLPQTTAVQETLGRLAEWRAQRAGVATQRPKAEALSQAQNRIAAAQARWQQTEAKANQARATLEQAQRDRQRAQELETSGAIARQAREQAELTETTRARELATATQESQAAIAERNAAQDALALLEAQQSDPDYLLDVYDARIASTEAELSRLKDEAVRTELRSPIRGKVLRVLQKSAQFVSEGTPLLELGDSNQIELVIDVLSTDAEKIQVGDRLMVQSNADAPTLKGTVRRVEPSAFTKVSALGVEEQRVNVIGEIADPTHRLEDGYRVDVQIVVWEGQRVVTVPLSALFRCVHEVSLKENRQNWCVFVVQNHRAERRKLQLGQRNSLAAEVRQGLAVNESVILHPTEKIKAGVRID
jgi:HlyD family secretion protein